MFTDAFCLEKLWISSKKTMYYRQFEYYVSSLYLWAAVFVAIVKDHPIHSPKTHSVTQQYDNKGFFPLLIRNTRFVYSSKNTIETCAH